MERAETITGVFAEYDAFAELISPLSPDEWRAPTRCEGWQVRDVAGHVAGTAIDVSSGAVGSRTPEDQARALRDETPAELAGRLRDAADRVRPFFTALNEEAWAGPSPVADRSLGNAVLTLVYDTFVHADDIRTALGRPAARGAGLEASLHWVGEELERRGWGPARIALDGVDERSIGTGGPVLRGDPLRFVLAATGRVDPAEFGVDESVNIYSLR
ncbi:maleylpyruvate isomerase family mycothiol-dependent enzyme [Actinomadura sp. DC4]|uniref:maleylpyruvate isomerase family mycothiol-dependent enzyme n=1 Tax=Actinomadura sp. DC4 TaxID=3055069 RepID=UPI0025B253D3|nr:maleylpyruvate isomerase family mycothiol-dependent enzyme [Actinomadura sp. DC4]MDN3353003.1 maleylpyruvate isomerase family mycothiol-dependent enzyme [Actinomadura sp. DC4]